ncbi:MAG: peptidase M15 [Muribaculaceae bacterium]|nr:peptidase M15 [Muribaculaceae bacterium]
MKLSKNFTLKEMIKSPTAERLHISNIPNEPELKKLKQLCVEILQPIRDKYKKPIRVTSGFRSSELNKVVKGSINSQHLRGEAADIVSCDNLLLWNIIIEMINKGELRVGQLINEKQLSWIHISLPAERSIRYNQILRL